MLNINNKVFYFNIRNNIFIILDITSLLGVGEYFIWTVRTNNDWPCGKLLIGFAACECDLQGSYDEFCNPSNGQCPCRQNTYGRQCNQCQPGFFNFPNCRKCVCNGHADTCEQTTGNCISCQDFTDGNNCERWEYAPEGWMGWNCENAITGCCVYKFIANC